MSGPALWGALPTAQVGGARVGLSGAEIEALRRPARSLILEGPRIYGPPVELRPWTYTPPVSDIGRCLRAASTGSASPTRPEDGFVPLSRPQAQAGLRAGVAEACWFAGYHEAEAGALHVLTDVLAHYLTNLSTRLKLEVDDRRLWGSAHRGFPHALERAFHDCLGHSILALGPYVRGVKRSIGRRLHSPHGGWDSPAEAESGRATPAGGLASEDVPEIHFPSSDEGDLDHAAQLESGLQMLQSLEQNGSLGSQGPHRSLEDDPLQQPMSQDSNAALLLATVSPATPGDGAHPRKKKRIDWQAGI